MDKIRLIILSLLIHTTLFGGVTGKISGRVVDKDTGQPLPGCNIVLKGTYLGAASSAEGDFIILNIPPGTYDLRTTMIGYALLTIENVSVSVDQTTTINLDMTVESIQGETVLVVYNRPAVQADRTSTQVHISEDVIRDLPVQEINDLIEIQSGITKDADGGLHVRGGRGSEVVYWIDGVPVTDSYDGSVTVEVDKNAIQELQLVSGTFNAEYGQAMSGIINIVTQTGGEKFNGSLDFQTGGYWATSDNIFIGLDKYKPLSIQNISGSFGGPLLTKNLRFYLSGRKYNSDGWLNGYHYFTPTGEPGDSSIANMNWQDKYSVNGKLSLFLTHNLNIHFNTLLSSRDYKDYNHFYQWNPDGNPFRFDNGQNYSLTLNHTLSSRTFYTVKASTAYSEYKQYLYEDPLDSRYVHPDSLNTPSYTFVTSGTNLYHYYRNTRTSLFKFDLISQATNKNLMKLGAEYRTHILEQEDFSITYKTDDQNIEIEPFEPDTLSTSTSSHGYYQEKPEEFSVFIQDKLEFQNFIVNIGLRFDYFNSNGHVLADPEDPNIYSPFKQEHINMTMAEREATWYEKAEPKTNISPRLGLAFPITDQGVIHFSFGHFYQMPSFQYLYNTGLKVTTSGGTYGPYGNADLKPQQTIMYELGLQQQLVKDLSADVTMFYRDIRNWVSTSTTIPTSIAGVSYVQYINRDYANVRGVVLSLKHNMLNSLYANVEYTFQVAEGSNSDPNDEYNSLLGNNEPTRYITPLAWDQRHTLNGAITYNRDCWNTALITRYGSGYPYTPSIGISTRTGLNASSVLPSNSRRKPATFEMDFRINYTIQLGEHSASIYCNVNNLFDARNATDVFSDTGESDYTNSIAN
ncbi:TonB-dependent receptor, partial [bacterium]|nr:TonB-dependent receptor [bacterium]